jgi:hypothetical protein
VSFAPNPILGDQLCVVSYLRTVACDKEYRRYPVVDNDGQSWEELGRYFYSHYFLYWYKSRNTDAAAAGRCNAIAVPVTTCIRVPSLPFHTSDCSCQVGFVALETKNIVTEKMETNCILDTVCKECKETSESPPLCSICAS